MKTKLLKILVFFSIISAIFVGILVKATYDMDKEMFNMEREGYPSFHWNPLIIQDKYLCISYIYRDSTDDFAQHVFWSLYPFGEVSGGIIAYPQSQ